MKKKLKEWKKKHKTEKERKKEDKIFMIEQKTEMVREKIANNIKYRKNTKHCNEGETGKNMNREKKEI